MENWQIALINETRRRQDQIAKADMHRLAMQIPAQPAGWRQIYQNLILKFAQLLIATGTRLQRRYNHLLPPSAAGVEASPCA